MKIVKSIIFYLLFVSLFNNISIYAKISFNPHGFFESAYNQRIVSDEHEDSSSLSEFRIQLDLSQSFDLFEFRLRSDILYDNKLEDHKINLNTGKGFIDLREANIVFFPLDFIDIKIGRQILTWGTADMIFINDLFPKDWQSFFIGRDSEYLKSPSDALRLSFYHDIANIELVYTPQFDSDRFINGERISYWNNYCNSITGQNAKVDVRKPDNSFKDDELAFRIYKNIKGIELALYYYQGFWKSPNGEDPENQVAIFPELKVLGSSYRTNLFKGIANLELGYYKSKNDTKGDNPLIRNSEFRCLLGYEQEIMKNLTASFQYYLEKMSKYKNYKQSLPSTYPQKDENRQLLTIRLTKVAFKQNLKISLFSFYSPSDKDCYLRPKINYKVDDNWLWEIGANIFHGQKDYTFFGQFTQNDNIYIRVRYGF